jgi:hypothetical protein
MNPEDEEPSTDLQSVACWRCGKRATGAARHAAAVQHALDEGFEPGEDRRWRCPVCAGQPITQH